MNYVKIYYSIIEKRKIDIPTGYVEEHHIIPRSLGGSDDKSNLVKLTAKEHFICHLLLTKMYKKGSNEYYKMCSAFLMMLVSSKDHNGNRYISSKKYEHLRMSFSERMSILQSGKNNSQYGTMWIHNKTLKQCKKVPKNSILKEGWEKGYIINWEKLSRKCIMCDNILLNEKYKKLCNECYYLEKSSGYIKNFSKKCSIDGIIYNSVGEAAKTLGMKRNSVQYRINSNGFETYFYIDHSDMV